MKNTIPLLLFAIVATIVLNACKGDASGVSPNYGIGRGGSTAKFTIAKNHLYVVNDSKLKVYDINAGTKSAVGTISINTVVETIFPLDDYLFIGTRTGMYIYDIQEPKNPQQLSVYNHVVSCDPVVAESKYAYVTLRTGTNCNRGVNLLDVIDISNIKSPRVINSVPLENPHGLGIDNNLLFITEGQKGLKVFDKSDPTKLKLIKNFTEIVAFDVIPEDHNLIVTGSGGIIQYNYDNINKIVETSTIKINP